MNFELKTGDFVLKTVDFVLKTADFVLKTADFVLKTGDFVAIARRTEEFTVISPDGIPGFSIENTRKCIDSHVNSP